MSTLTRCIPIALIAAVCLAARVVEAQHPWFWGWGASRYGYGYYGYGYRAAGYDPVTGTRMAHADMIRAAGQSAQALGLGLEVHSRALINYEQARARHIENVDRWTDVYVERRRRYERQREYERERAKEELARRRRNRPDPAPPHLPSPEQLDPSSGEIEWPTPLLDEEYFELRDALEREFAVRAQTSGAAGNERHIRELAGKMRDLLRSNIREMPSYEYIAARKLIDGLANAARL